MVGGMVRQWEFIYTHRIHETIAYIPIHVFVDFYGWM